MLTAAAGSVAAGGPATGTIAVRLVAGLAAGGALSGVATTRASLGRAATAVQTRRWVTIGAAGAVGAAVADRYGATWTGAAMVVLAAGLVVLAAADLACHLLPRRLVRATGAFCLVLLAIGAAAGGVLGAGFGDRTGGWDRLAVAVGCGLAVGIVFWALHRRSARLLGRGDVRLGILLGLGLGWLGVPSLLIGLVVANAAGVVVALAAMALRRARLDTPLPYGAFLALGALVAIGLGGALG